MPGRREVVMIRRATHDRADRWLPFAGGVLACLLATCVSQGVARAERIANDVAIFSTLDKVTARISRLEVPLGQTKVFGSLKVTPRVCYTRPSTEQPKTTSFVEVDELLIDGTEKRLFTGWMFAESPGLNAVEHPVFDVWLSGCRGGATTAAKETPGDAGATSTGAETKAEEEEPVRRRRRIRR